MTQPVSSAIALARPHTADSKLFSGIRLRWSVLTQTEKVVTLIIVLLPVLWMLGVFRFAGPLLVAGIFGYSLHTTGRLPLKMPIPFATSALIVFALYRFFGSYFFGLYNPGETSLSGLIRSSVMFWFPIALLLWYIQSNNLKVRTPVVAWAFSFLVIQMIVTWIIVYGVLGGGAYNAPRNLAGILTGAPTSYTDDAGLANYLIPYRPRDILFGSVSRWSFFFIIPEILALYIAYVALLAMDLRDRVWSFSLLFGCGLLLFISGTRSVWLSLPIVMSVRFLFMLGKRQGYFLPLLIVALVSFLTLMMPDITNGLIDSYSCATDAVGSVRADSTDVRNDIYDETIRRIPDRLWLGHWSTGETVLPGFELARVGSHSFILGTLLYRMGIVGLAMFLVFWVALWLWMYQTSEGRPLAGFGLLLIFTLVSPVMEFGEIIAWLLLLLAVVVRYPKSKGATL